jgi:hypothetical protein
MDAAKERAERWVCTGTREFDGKLYQTWYLLKDGPVGDVHAYAKPLAPGQAGMIYDVITDGDSVYTKGDKGLKYVGMYHDDAQVQEWRALTAAAEVEQRLEKRMRKEVTEDVLKTALEPLRLACKKTDRTGRYAIKAMVLEYLDKWGV